jgi:hypothetical protein
MSEIKPTPTPGPWEIDERFPGCYGIEPNVAWLGASSSHQPGENLANARLIAAAPDMLAALENCLYIGASESLKEKIRDQARAAILKAKGEL